MPKLVIVGGGPAGVSAALYSRRANIETLIVANKKSSLGKAESIDNYYGFPYGISGAELYSAGLEQAGNLGVEIVEDEVVGVDFSNPYTVKTSKGAYPCECVIIATGAQRRTPPIPGLVGFEGSGVSYCAVCDAFFYRGKDVAVLGGGEYALSEARELAHVAGSVTVLTDGEKPDSVFPESMQIIDKKIKLLRGSERLSHIVFEDGTELAVEGCFVAYGSAGSSDLAKKLGAQTNGSAILVDESCATTVPGIFAAGDCTGGLLQVAKAVYQGMIAGTQAVKYLRSKRDKE
ncbi:MAG: NAD(P)/FAD-dependent oxidoreductase [Oscillospiraceae bacterium]